MREEVSDQMKTSEFRDVNLEKIVIAGCLKFTEIIMKCKDSFKPDYISSSRCRWIYQEIIDFYEKQNTNMNTEAFKILITQKQLNIRKGYTKLWNSIIIRKKKLEIPTCYAAITKLADLYKARLMEMGISRTIKLLTQAVNGGQEYIERAVNNYTKITEELQTKPVFVSLTDPFKLYNDFKKDFLQTQKDPKSRLGVPTGIEQLDNRMKGLRPSEFGLIFAPSGRGKSIMLLDFGYNCFLGYGNVLYITIEMPENQVRERFYCRRSGIPYERFRNYRLTKEDFELLDRKMSSKQEHSFFIMDIPQSCNVSTLAAEIDSFMKRMWKPKLIVIDYMNILEGGYDWQVQLEMAKQIKQKIARYFKIPVWSANQMGAASSDKEDLGARDIAFSKNVIDHIDVGISIGLTDASDEEIYNIGFLKTRDFSAKSFQIQADRDRMTFLKSVKSNAEDKSGYTKKEEKIKL